jgi:hypothetical protein
MSRCVGANDVLGRALRTGGLPDVVVIEKIESYGMAVGAEVFDTVWWAGRFAEAANRLEATMARLDAEAAAAVVRPSRIPTAAEARAYLESLPDLWAKTSDAGRHAIAEAGFERIDVLGAYDFTFALTAHARARGWDAAFGAGVVRVKEGQSGRGERSRDDDFDRLAEPAREGRWLDSVIPDGIIHSCR